jgi:hypothetical protein
MKAEEYIQERFLEMYEKGEWKGAFDYKANPSISKVMEEYSSLQIKEAIEEIEAKLESWKYHGNYYICGGLQEAIEILKSKIK